MIFPERVRVPIKKGLSVWGELNRGGGKDRGGKQRGGSQMHA